MNLTRAEKLAIVDVWSFLHQPAQFNKLTYKRCGRQTFTILENSLSIHATKHPEIVEIGRNNSKNHSLSNERAYLKGIIVLLKYFYTDVRKKGHSYEINCTEKRTRISFIYNDNRVVIVLDHDRSHKYKREVSAVTCYYKTL